MIIKWMSEKLGVPAWLITTAMLVAAVLFYIG